ncbi:15101_t:CDS:2, partial [Racocetra persica]
MSAIPMNHLESLQSFIYHEKRIVCRGKLHSSGSISDDPSFLNSHCFSGYLQILQKHSLIQAQFFITSKNALGIRSIH